MCIKDVGHIYFSFLTNSRQEWSVQRQGLRWRQIQSRCCHRRMGQSQRNQLLDRPQFMGIPLGGKRLFPYRTRRQQMQNRNLSCLRSS